MNQNQKITACGFLHKDGKLFVARRAKTKKFLPDKFELAGGHIECEESIEDGLKREFQEEFGVDIKVGFPFYAFTYMNRDEHTVEIDYFVELADLNQEIKLNPEDHSECRWATEAEIDSIWDKNDEEYKAIKRGFLYLKDFRSISI